MPPQANFSHPDADARTRMFRELAREADATRPSFEHAKPSDAKLTGVPSASPKSAR